MLLNKKDKEITLYREDLNEWVKNKDHNSITVYDFKLSHEVIDLAAYIRFIDEGFAHKVFKDRYPHKRDISIKGGESMFDQSYLIVTCRPNKN